MTFSGLPYCSAAVQNPSPSQSTLDSRAMQAADLIGVRKQVEEIVSFQKGRYDRQNVPLHLIDLRGRTYQSIMGGVCDVRVATNKIERELTYTYAQYRKEVSKIQEVDQMFNLMNFAQFSVLYSLEGLSRQKNQFNQSSILVAVSSGLGLLLPTMNIIYDKMARRKAAPPERFSMLVEGVAVTDLKMPDLVARFMNSKSPGASQTRKEQMYATWKDRYGTDAMTKDAFYSLLDGKKKSQGELYSRIVHLWSLHMFVQELNDDLLALLRTIQPTPYSGSGGPAKLEALGLNDKGMVACKLLGIEAELSEYISLCQSRSNPQRQVELETNLIGRVLLASLEARTASDNRNEEMNYAYDVVLADLEARRNRLSQMTYNANFIQTNAIGCVASGLYLKDYNVQGNELFTIASSVGIALTTFGVYVMRGGKRKIDTPPNTLADFFDLRPDSEKALSPFALAYLESPDPTT